MKFATSARLSARMLAIPADPARHAALPPDIREWVDLEARISALPRPGTLPCEIFPRADRWHLAI